MRAHFKQSVQIGGTTYKNGSIHSLSKEVLAHPAFKHFHKAGLIISADKAALAAQPPMTEQQRLETLAAKLAPQKVVSDAHLEELASSGVEEDDSGHDYEPEVSEEDFDSDDDEEVFEETEEDEPVAKKSVKKKAKKKR